MGFALQSTLCVNDNLISALQCSEIMRSRRWETVIDRFAALQGVSHDSVLSPYFYNVMAEFLIRLHVVALDGFRGGICWRLVNKNQMMAECMTDNRASYASVRL